MRTCLVCGFGLFGVVGLCFGFGAGVYVLDSTEVVASIPANSKFKVISSHDPDYTLYEAHTFCELLLKGNPKVIEPLFQTHLCHWEPGCAWAELVANRHIFLNSTVIQQYKGFASSQLHDSSRGKGKATKKYYHALRLLREAKRMTNFEPPAVWMEGEEREYLMSVRHNKVPQEVLETEIKETFSYLKDKLNDREFLATLNNGRSEDQLKAFLHPWLIKLRRGTLPRTATSETEVKSSHPLFLLASQECYVAVYPAKIYIVAEI